MKTSLAMISFCCFIALACSEEKNPYQGRYGTSTQGATSSSANGAVSSNQSAANSANTQPSAESKAAAPEGAIAQQSASLVQGICASGSKFPNLAAELKVLCINGQATQAFANALAAPYKGGANPNLITIQSTAANNQSEFMLLAIIEIPKPLSAVLAKRDLTHKGTFTEGNATVTQTELAATAGDGVNNLGSYDVKFDLTVRVGIITVADTRVLFQDFLSLNADKSLIASTSFLKAGAPDNTDNFLANGLSFWLGEGNTTKIISVNHQIVDNRGQATTAETTALGIGRRTMLETFNALNQ